jgi:hypothetical protein
MTENMFSFRLSQRRAPDWSSAKQVIRTGVAELLCRTFAAMFRADKRNIRAAETFS